MQPLWISHRGLKTRHDENTVGAFDAALEHGFSHLETDLRLSKDGKIVLLHDPDLSRVAGIKKKVWELQSDELEKITLRKGGSILFFDEFITRYSEVGWTLDIKEESGANVARQLVEILSATSSQNDIKFLPWLTPVEKILFDAFPSRQFYANKLECYRAGLTILTGLDAFSGIIKSRYYAIPPRLGPVDLYKSDLIARFKRRGGGTTAFLPETERDAAAAVNAGVDEILTNHIPLR